MLVRDVRPGSWSQCRTIAFPRLRSAATGRGRMHLGVGAVAADRVRFRSGSATSHLRRPRQSAGAAIPRGARTDGCVRASFVVADDSFVGGRIGVVAQVHRRPIVGSAAGRIRIRLLPHREHAWTRAPCPGWAITARHRRRSSMTGLAIRWGCPFSRRWRPCCRHFCHRWPVARPSILPGLISQATTAPPALAQSAPAPAPSMAPPQPAPDASNAPTPPPHTDARSASDTDAGCKSTPGDAGTAHADATSGRSRRTDARARAEWSTDGSAGSVTASRSPTWSPDADEFSHWSSRARRSRVSGSRQDSKASNCMAGLDSMAGVAVKRQSGCSE